MTKRLNNNINSTIAFNDKINTDYIIKNKAAKFVVLKLDDLNVEIIKLLNKKQCAMMLLEEESLIIKQQKTNQTKHILLLINGRKQSVTIENIIRLEACGNYTNVFIKDFDEPILTSKTLKHYVGLLGEDLFLRLHNKHFVNIHYILALTHNKQIKMQNGVSLPISRRKLNDVKQLMHSKNIA